MPTDWLPEDGSQDDGSEDLGHLALIELLCRTQLLALRLGCRIVVAHPSQELRELIRLVGVDNVLLCPGCIDPQIGSAEPTSPVSPPTPVGFGPWPRPPAVGTGP